MRGSLVVSVLDAANREVRGSNPYRDRNLFDISVPPAPPSQLSFDEYTDRTLRRAQLNIAVRRLHRVGCGAHVNFV